MAGGLKFWRRLLPFPALLAGAVNFGQAQSDATLADPTRPPTAIIEPVTTTAAEAVPPPSGLQSIILGKGRKPMAVINGVTVELGDKVGDATLVKISESAVVLKGPAGRETLQLTPGVERVNSLRPRQGMEAEHTQAAGRPKRSATP